MVYEEYENELSPEDIFNMEIDQGEMQEIEKSLITPEGRYFPETPFEFKVKFFEVEVNGKDGETRKVNRPVINFWGTCHNEQGQEYKLGISVSPLPLYRVYDGDTAIYFETPVDGAKADGPTKNKNQANKLYKKLHKEWPKNFGELVEFLRVTELRLENRVFEGDDGVHSAVVGFNLRDA